jgi:hypothetical protein
MQHKEMSLCLASDRPTVQHQLSPQYARLELFLLQLALSITSLLLNRLFTPITASRDLLQICQWPLIRVPQRFDYLSTIAEKQNVQHLSPSTQEEKLPPSQNADGRYLPYAFVTRTAEQTRLMI